MAEFALPVPAGTGDFFEMARFAQQSEPAVANVLWETAVGHAKTPLEQGIALRGQSVAQSAMGQGALAIEYAKMAWEYHHEGGYEGDGLLPQRAETSRVLGVTLLRPIVRHEYAGLICKDEATELAAEARKHLDQAVRDSTGHGQLGSLHLATTTRASIAESLYGDPTAGANTASYAGMAWKVISDRPEVSVVFRAMDGLRTKPDAARHALGAQTVAALMRTPHRGRRTAALAVAQNRTFGL